MGGGRGHGRLGGGLGLEAGGVLRGTGIGVRALGERVRVSLAAQLVKNPPAMRETWVRSLGWEDSPGEGKGYPLQYSGLENSMDCIVRGVAESDTTERLSLSLGKGGQDQDPWGESRAQGLRVGTRGEGGCGKVGRGALREERTDGWEVVVGPKGKG